MNKDPKWNEDTKRRREVKTEGNIQTKTVNNVQMNTK